MEVRLETLGAELPRDCFVSVRLGESLKQRRWDPSSCCYHFPLPERRRTAKIDVYKLVGTCAASVDPEMSTSDEVKLMAVEPDAAPFKFRVSVTTKPTALKDDAKTREARTKDAKDSALGYLQSHKVEEKLAEAIRLLLKVRPDDPVDFICSHLRGPAAGPPPVPEQKAHVAQPAPVVERLAAPPARAEASAGLAHRHASVAGPAAVVKAGWNLSGLSAAFLDERLEAERLITKALLNMTDSLSGQYMPLATSMSYAPRPGGMSENELAELAAAGHLFQASDAAGRGVFLLDSLKAAVWVNECAHLQIRASKGVPEGEAVSLLRALAAALGDALYQFGYGFNDSVKLGRCIHGFHDPEAMVSDERNEVERLVTRALGEFSGELHGEYFPMNSSTSYIAKPGGMSQDDEKALLPRGVDLWAGLGASGRGVYEAQSGALVCINCGSAGHHILFIGQPGASMDDVERLESAVAESLRQDGYLLV